MQKGKQKSGVIGGVLLPMGLICLFAFCSLALALLGGDAYTGIQANVDESYGSTVAASYLRNKVSQSGSYGAVTLREEGGLQVLVLTTSLESGDYETRIYYSGGALKENYVEAGAPFNPEGGTKIAELTECSFEIAEDGLFTARLASNAGQRPVETRVAVALLEGGAL